jgi:hypothetical protein
MLVDTIPSVEPFPSSITDEEFVAELYSRFIEKILVDDRNRTLILSPKERRLFLQALALDLLRANAKDFQWNSFPPLSRVLREKWQKEGRRPDWIDYDLRNSPLLQRRSDQFSFIHQSFAEFFIAHSIVEYLLGTESEIWTDADEMSFGEGVRRFIFGIISQLQDRGRNIYVIEEHQIPFAPAMLFVPSGPYIAGGYDSGLKIKNLKRPILISKYPVTWKEYEAFKPGVRDQISVVANDTTPVTWVSWTDALEYCDWLSRQSNSYVQFRLPSEEEWEKAARGIDGRLYPWGDDTATSERANYDNNADRSSPVDQYPLGISPYGILNMSGNVAELTATSQDDGISHICRGGSWQDPASGIRCAARRVVRFRSKFNDVGFRIALDINQEVHT